MGNACRRRRGRPARASDAERVVDEAFGGRGEAADERGVVRLERGEGALFGDGARREALLVEADERDAHGGRVGDDEPLARETRRAVQLDDANVGVARRLPVRLAEDVDALRDVGDAHVSVDDRLHPRQPLEASVEAPAAVRPEQHRVLDEQAQVFERRHLRPEAEGRALLEVAARDVCDRPEVFDTTAGGG